MLPVVGVCSGVFQNNGAQQLVGWSVRNVDIMDKIFFKKSLLLLQVSSFPVPVKKINTTWRCSDL